MSRFEVQLLVPELPGQRRASHATQQKQGETLGQPAAARVAKKMAFFTFSHELGPHCGSADLDRD